MIQKNVCQICRVRVLSGNTKRDTTIVGLSQICSTFYRQPHCRLVVFRIQKTLIRSLTEYLSIIPINGQLRDVLDIQQCIRDVQITCYRIIHGAVNVDRDRLGAVNDDLFRVITAQNIFALTANLVSVLQHRACDCRLRAYAAFRVCRRPPPDANALTGRTEAIMHAASAALMNRMPDFLMVQILHLSLFFLPKRQVYT